MERMATFGFTGGDRGASGGVPWELWYPLEMVKRGVPESLEAKWADMQGEAQGIRTSDGMWKRNEEAGELRRLRLLGM